MEIFVSLAAIGFVVIAMAFIVVYRLMFYMPGKSGGKQPPLLRVSEPELAISLERHVQMLATTIGARSLTRSSDGLAQSAQYIADCFESYGLSVTQQEYAIETDAVRKRQEKSLGTEFQFDVMGKTSSNVIAEIKGSIKPDEIVVIGAHYDSVFDCPAANDNGSGVATLLEIAAYCAQVKMDRTLRFVAFTNEEPPFFGTKDMGSYQYAQQCRQNGDNIVAMLSLETLGYYSDEPNSQDYPKPFNLFYPSKGNFLAFVSNIKCRELTRKCVRAFRDSAAFPSEGICAPEKISGVGFSDHAAFWRFDYPGVMVTDTAFCRYPHYHKPQDTADKVNYEKLALVTQGLIHVVAELTF